MPVASAIGLSGFASLLRATASVRDFGRDSDLTIGTLPPRFRTEHGARLHPALRCPDAAQHLQHVIVRNGIAVEIALTELTTRRTQERRIFLSLNANGDDFLVELSRHRNDRADDTCAIAVTPATRFHQVALQLDRFKWQTANMGQ